MGLVNPHKKKNKQHIYEHKGGSLLKLIGSSSYFLNLQSNTLSISITLLVCPILFGHRV